MAVSDGTVAADRSAVISISSLALASGFLGWMFDAMDLNLFTLVLFPSVAQLTETPVPRRSPRSAVTSWLPSCCAGASAASSAGWPPTASAAPAPW